MFCRFALVNPYQPDVRYQQMLAYVA